MRRAPGRKSTARRLLERRTGVALQRRRDVRHRATVDDVHDLRVATRRLQEAIDVLAFALPTREMERARRRIQRIRRSLAEVRDADVLVDTLDRLARKAPPGDRGGIAALRRALALRAGQTRDRRRRGGTKASPAAGAGGSPAGGPPLADAGEAPGASPDSTANGPQAVAGSWQRGAVAAVVAALTAPPAGLRVRGLRRRMRDLLGSLPAVPARDLHAAAGRMLSQRAAAVEAGLVRARSGRAGDLHRLRIAIKKYRYTLEVMHEARAGGHARAIAAAKRLQEALGRLHDTDVLLALLRRGGEAARPILGGVRAARRALLKEALAIAAGFRPRRWRTRPGAAA